VMIVRLSRRNAPRCIEAARSPFFESWTTPRMPTKVQMFNLPSLHLLLPYTYQWSSALIFKLSTQEQRLIMKLSILIGVLSATIAIASPAAVSFSSMKRLCFY
jgi:hypothetical protein